MLHFFLGRAITIHALNLGKATPFSRRLQVGGKPRLVRADLPSADKRVSQLALTRVLTRDE
jgi:hypothetical protein